MGFPDWNPSLFCTDPDPSINKQKSKKNLDFYYRYILTSFLLFISENDVSVPSTVTSKIYFLSASCQLTDEKSVIWIRTPEPDSDPNPLVSGTDPRIRICTKMSRIHNTGTALNPPLSTAESQIQMYRTTHIFVSSYYLAFHV